MMKKIRLVSENVMVAEFLKGEILSPRWRKIILRILNKSKIDKQILENPNLKDNKENTQTNPAKKDHQSLPFKVSLIPNKGFKRYKSKDPEKKPSTINILKNRGFVFVSFRGITYKLKNSELITAKR